MNLLAIDCATQVCHLALAKGERIQQCDIGQEQRHTDSILSVIKDLLTQQHLKLAQLDGIVYTAGPGSFTGIRVTLSVVQGISFAQQIPTIPLSTLQVLAQGSLRRHGWKKIIVAHDARMGQLYCGEYQCQSDGIMKANRSDELCNPQEINVPDSRDWSGIGNGLSIYQENIPNMIKKLPWDRVESIAVKDMIDLARSGSIAENSPQKLALPNYIREDVAKKRSR